MDSRTQLVARINALHYHLMSQQQQVEKCKDAIFHKKEYLIVAGLSIFLIAGILIAKSPKKIKNLSNQIMGITQVIFLNYLKKILI